MQTRARNFIISIFRAAAGAASPKSTAIYSIWHWGHCAQRNAMAHCHRGRWSRIIRARRARNSFVSPARGARVGLSLRAREARAWFFRCGLRTTVEAGVEHDIVLIAASGFGCERANATALRGCLARDTANQVVPRRAENEPRMYRRRLPLAAFSRASAQFTG
jgi:hypothetical protein